MMFDRVFGAEAVLPDVLIGDRPDVVSVHLKGDETLIARRIADPP